MTDKTKAFFDQRDENGLSNREKIRLHQQVIRRLPETDKTKSYEASSARSDGIVMQNGKMIGFGIHILNATGCPLTEILSLAPQREQPLPLQLTSGEGGHVGLKFNPVYNAQWKETGEWQQTYFAYPQEKYIFKGWYSPDGTLLSTQEQWQDEYGSSRILQAVFTTESA